MKILVIGSGGREHALVWKLKQSPKVTQIFCAPGNGGIAQSATCVPIKISEQKKLLDFAQAQNIDLTVVGPDDALANGIVDLFESAGLSIFGPNQAAARLESSKVFSKEFMLRHGIPTARSGNFTDSAEARRFAQSMPLPVVVKADGLALGKGVIIAQTREEADRAIREIMDEKKFGAAGNAVVIEECLTGPECSIHALVDGENYLLFPGAQDHKRALDHDAGLNTGGMGTFSPTPMLTPQLEQTVRTEVLDRFIAGLKADGIRYRGMLFPGLMLTPCGPRVLEFNCRFGDPETQVLLSLLESDLLELLQATVDGTLAQKKATWKKGSAVCVIMASGGYPESYETGKPISGLAEASQSSVVFHAGTRMDTSGFTTSGGRVLGVTSTGPDLATARQEAYGALAKIHFENAHYRKDIAVKGLPENTSL